MTATEELRRLLDERGVEYTVVPEDMYSREYIKIGSTEIRTNGRDEVAVYYLTPEQAVEATLGRGTCRMEKRHMDWLCTGCGEIVGTDDPTSELFIDGNAVELWNYCPNCGRRRVG